MNLLSTSGIFLKQFRFKNNIVQTITDFYFIQKQNIKKNTVKHTFYVVF